MTTRERLMLMAKAQLPSLVLWLPLLAVAMLFDAHLPSGGWNRYAPSDSWQNLITFVLIVNFLWTKAWLLIRRMPYIDWLTISLASVNWNFVAIYLFAVALVAWPQVFYQFVTGAPPPPLKWWAHDVLILLRTTLILNLIWSTYMLAVVPEPIYEDGTQGGEA